MTNATVRNARTSDRNRIVAFDHLAQLDAGRISFIDRVLSSGMCLVADLEGRAVGYGALEYTFYENGFVSLVYVAEPERRRGIGRRLVEALAERCRTPKLFTSTNQSNKPMQALLESLGYVRSGTIQNLDPGDPELVYFLDLRRHVAYPQVGAAARRDPRDHKSLQRQGR